MPNFNGILEELAAVNLDTVRRKYLGEFAKKTGRNVIAYYSGWLQKQSEVPQKLVITDSDMNGFMSCIHGMDKKQGLDLILHTPGGEVNTTEALVNYIRSIFANDVRAFVPQLAMSAGTMIALSCKEIWMGKHSSIGPIDPQVGGVPAHGIVEEWKRAKKEIKSDPVLANAWEPILRRYHPTLVGQCEKSIKMADTIVTKWLDDGAISHIKNQVERKQRQKEIIKALGKHKETLNHGRHVGVEQAIGLGLNIKRLEDPSHKDIQEVLLSVHHAFCITFSKAACTKIIENHKGCALIMN